MLPVLLAPEGLLSPPEQVHEDEEADGFAIRGCVGGALPDAPVGRLVRAPREVGVFALEELVQVLAK